MTTDQDAATVREAIDHGGGCDCKFDAALDRLTARIAELEEDVAHWRRVALAAGATDPRRQEPATCPTCGSSDRELRRGVPWGTRMESGLMKLDRSCADPWHGEEPTKYDPQWAVQPKEEPGHGYHEAGDYP